MFNVVLVHPEIPHNTGSVGRLCLAIGARLHLVKPLGFDLSEKAVKRAGLDYWPHVDLRVWENIEVFKEHLKEDGKCIFLMTTKTDKPYWNANFKEGDYLLFGAETKGLPESLINEYRDGALTIPINKDVVRSLNLATSVGIVLFDAARQQETPC